MSMAEVEEEMIKIENWKEQIREAYYQKEDWNIWFHDKIWEMSLTAFDIAREVQVIIDSNDKLFISVGTPALYPLKDKKENYRE